MGLPSMIEEKGYSIVYGKNRETIKTAVLKLITYLYNSTGFNLLWLVKFLNLNFVSSFSSISCSLLNEYLY